MNIAKDCDNVGFDVNIFLVKPNTDFVCSICFSILKDPHQCMNGHCYCFDCISAALKVRSECPQCRTYLTHGHLSNNLFVKNLVDVMHVYCSNSRHRSISDNDHSTSESYCEWTGPLHLLADHLSGDCLVEPIECSHLKCIDMIPRGHLVQHEQNCPHRLLSCSFCDLVNTAVIIGIHEENCIHRPTQCSHCGEKLIYCELESHIESKCDMQLVDCPLAMLRQSGATVHRCCSGRMLRKELYSHLCGVTTVSANSTGECQKGDTMSNCNSAEIVNTITVLCHSISEMTINMQSVRDTLTSVITTNQHLAQQLHQMSVYQSLCSIVYSLLLTLSDMHTLGSTQYFFSYETVGEIHVLHKWLKLIHPHSDSDVVDLLVQHLSPRLSLQSLSTMNMNMNMCSTGIHDYDRHNASYFVDWEIDCTMFITTNGTLDKAATASLKEFSYVSPGKCLFPGVMGYISMVCQNKDVIFFSCIVKGYEFEYDIVLSLFRLHDCLCVVDRKEVSPLCSISRHIVDSNHCIPFSCASFVNDGYICGNSCIGSDKVCGNYNENKLRVLATFIFSGVRL